jgi:hypothetical protein
MLAQIIDFDKPIHVIGWSQNTPLFSLPACLGLELMAESRRWDDQHVASNVRVLPEKDRLAANVKLGIDIPESYPVYFTQEQVDGTVELSLG